MIDKSLWEERYEDEKYGLEPLASFRLFNRLLLKVDRTMTIFAEELVYEKIDEQSESNRRDYEPPTKEEIEKKINSRYRSLCTYSQKFKWQMRFDAYDLHFKELHIKYKERAIIDWEVKQLKYAMIRSNLHNDTINKIHDAPEDNFPLAKKVYAESENQRAYVSSLDAVYKLLYGNVEKRQNKNENTGEIELNTNVTTKKSKEELDNENKDYFNELNKDFSKENQQED